MLIYRMVILLYHFASFQDRRLRVERRVPPRPQPPCFFTFKQVRRPTARHLHHWGKPLDRFMIASVLFLYQLPEFTRVARFPRQSCSEPRCPGLFTSCLVSSRNRVEFIRLIIRFVLFMALLLVRVLPHYIKNDDFGCGCHIVLFQYVLSSSSAPEPSTFLHSPRFPLLL